MTPEDRGELICMSPIGTVKNDVNEPRHEGWSEVVSQIVLRSELEEMLDGVDQFSHLDILFWLDRLPKHHFTKLHPRDRQDLPLVGVLATRTQYRPNPIAVTTVRLLARQGTTLTVKGLDALNGTPVLDIKPYVPLYEPSEGVVVAEWVHRIQPY
ncbi:MAG: tRNA (N6-threonylcarbamoyladenosine(37)-N6)-methyltransferase TrmO [Chloroflexota bacterium]|nr:MAG: tRNA (N6-threonylcarbamoyladenosine(37)-N6)-methyltransferase TrmO [Chloroflexota bacterium]